MRFLSCRNVIRFWLPALVLMAGFETVRAQVPVVTAITPDSGVTGTTVNITGSGFNSATTGNVVYFGAVKGNVTAASTTSLTVTTDTGTTYAPLSVLNTASGYTGLSSKFFNPTFVNNYFIPGGINFKPKVDFATGVRSSPHNVISVDMDGDGKPDLAVLNSGDDSVSGNVKVYLNVSTPGTLSSSSFSLVATYTALNFPSGIKMADVNGDGKPEIIISRRESREMFVFRNTSSLGSISFAAADSFSTGVFKPNIVAAGDFDGDGLIDMAATVTDSGRVVVLRNTYSGGGLSFAAAVDYPAPKALGICVGDWNNDGKTDIAVIDTVVNNISVFRNTATAGTIDAGSFASPVVIASGADPIDLQTGDIDGDGNLDLIYSNSFSDRISVIRNTSSSGAISFSSPVTFNTGTLPIGIATGDINGDGKIDVVVANGYAANFSVFRNTATSGSITSGSFAAAVSFGVSYGPLGITISDLDGDRYPDVITANSAGYSFSIVRNYPLPNIDTIGGPTPICFTASPITYTNATTGGTWSVSNTSLATISATGVLTPIRPGTETILYRKVAGGDTNTVSKIVIIDTTAYVSAISGVSGICVGSSATLTDSVSGGVWTTSNSAVVSVSSAGVIRGITAGTATITYRRTNACGTAFATKSIISNTAPFAGTITGPSSVCVGTTITLTDTVSGGGWTSSNTAIATVHPTSGVVTGVAAGGATITYTVNSGCGTAFVTKAITVNTMSSPGPITGTTTVCVGDTTTLSSTPTGGVWTSASPAVATINASSGRVTGVSAGTAIVSYTITGSCGSMTSTATVTVNPLPFAGTITGTSRICSSGSTTLTDTASGGVWSSANPAVATINTTGTVTAVSIGSTIISYTVTNSCGTARDTMAFYVDSVAPVIAGITGPAAVCEGGATITLANAVAGGTWASSNTARATVNPSTGVVTGITAGSVTITYTVTNGCGVNDTTRALTVSPLPSTASIIGPATVCIGATINLTDTTTGGTWTSSNTARATVSTTGQVGGVSAGTVNISYSFTNSCGTSDSFKTITVNPAPAAGSITGTPTVCVGDTTTLASSVGGGTWSSANTSTATVNTTGTVGGVAAGTVLISYSVTNGCGTADSTISVTVNPLPVAGTISGPASVCIGAAISLGTTGTGGAWSSGSPSVASVSTSGLVNGVATGTAVISYTVINGCGSASDTQRITVNALPSVGTITGTATVCAGSTTTLADTTTGGTWTSSNTAVATVTSTGVVHGVAGGSVAISYSVTNSCGTTDSTRIVTVSPAPVAGNITGAGSVCQGATTSLSTTGSGGTWSSSATGIATAEAATGVVGGVSAGSAVISYTVTNSCGSASDTFSLIVNPLPAAGTLSGTTPLCAGTSAAWVSTVAGGTWSTSNVAVASVSSTGDVTGVSAGTSVISYIVTNACGADTAARTVNVTAIPVATAITGPSSVCIGSTVTETGAGTIAAWLLSNGNATAGSASGSSISITGVTAGVDTLNYVVSNTCGSDTSAPQVINIIATPNAGTITGPSSVCVGNDVQLTDSTASAAGNWSTTASAVASVNAATGLVRGLSAGTAVVTYSVTTAACGNASTTYTVTVSSIPVAGTITGADSVCAGRTTTLTGTGSGTYWATSNAAIASVGTTSGIVTGVATGSAIIYLIDSSACGADSASHNIFVRPAAPSAGTISGVDSACAGAQVTLTATATGGTWSSSNTAVATVSNTGNVFALTAGSTTVSYTVTNTCGTQSATHAFTVRSAPQFTSLTTGSVCDSNLFNYTPATNIAADSYTWSRAVVTGLANSVNSGAGNISEYLDNTTNAPVTAVYVYIATKNGCTDTLTLNVAVNPIPRLLNNLSRSICSGADFVFLDSPSTGALTTATWTRAAVIGITPATNSGTGIINEPLTNTTTGNLSVTYVYVLSLNSCSAIESVVVTVSPSPVFPRITTHSPVNMCTSASFQNFGAGTAPATGERYEWSAGGGATVWATGNDRQYCLVNFNNPGLSVVYLKASLSGSGCVGIDSFIVAVGTNIAEKTEVIYFNHEFVCLQNQKDTYQWGFDNKLTLDSTILDGQTNQNFSNDNPDIISNYYWVMTTHNGCMQKSYFKEPTGVINVNAPAAMLASVKPNPSSGAFNVLLTSATTQEAKVVITDLLGRKIKELTMTTNRDTAVQLTEAAGIYFLNATTSTSSYTAKIVVE